MRAIAISAAILAVLGLAGCDNKPKDEKHVSISTPEGNVTISGQGNKFTMRSNDGKSTVEINGGGVGTAAKMPAYAPLYPGAAVQSSVVGNSSDGTGGMVSFQSNASPQEVIDFYKAKARDFGFSESMSANTGGTMVFAANAKTGNKGLQVTAAKSDKGTTAQVFWSGK